MIPMDLQKELKERLEQEFADKLFENPNGELVPIQIFEQHLPQKQKEDLSLYPYIIIQLNNGTQANETAAEGIKVVFLIGVFQEDSENQGYRNVVRVINRISSNLKQNPTVKRQFQLNYPYDWALYDEDVAPYFFGGIETTWNVPTFSRTEAEEMI